MNINSTNNFGGSIHPMKLVNALVPLSHRAEAGIRSHRGLTSTGESRT